MAYQYTIFGLNVRSEVPLNASEVEFTDEDVRIVLGTVPDKLLSPAVVIDSCLVNEKEFYFHIEGLAKYYISNGTDIILELVGEYNQKDIGLFLLGGAFGMLMLQRNIFCLHGSAVKKDNQCIVLMGASGVGKTSLAAKFIEYNWKLLSDDMARIDFQDNVCMVHSSYPSQKMWENTAKELGIEIETEKRLLNRYDKYYIENHGNFLQTVSKVDMIIELVPDIDAPIEIVKLEAGKSISALIKNTYRYRMLSSQELLKRHFQYVSTIAGYVPVYRLQRPKDIFCLQEQMELILKMLKEIKR